MHKTDKPDDNLLLKKLQTLQYKQNSKDKYLYFKVSKPVVTEDNARSWKCRKLVYSCNFQVYCIKQFIHKHIQMTTTLIVRCSLACVCHCTSDADHSLSAEPTFTCQFPRISYLHLSLTSIVFLIKY